MFGSILLVQSVCIGLALGKSVNKAIKTEDVEFLMSHVQPKLPDTYLCHKMKMNKTATYITGFIPHANMEVAHHILLYGCGSPGRDLDVWNCGEMSSNENRGNYTLGPVCQEGSKIIYAWAMDAPMLNLPKDVAFKVGGNTDVKYLVLQVHYKNVEKFLPPKSELDSSGITLVTTTTPKPKRAGVYLLGTMGNIPQHNTVYMEAACSYRDNVEIHPFAFRTHTHTLGKVVSGYRIRDGKWTEIGRKSPRLPQMFYNATTPNLTVRRGDILAARCTMKNDLDRDVRIGSTQNDEMCNFYIMYYVDGGKIMESNYCFSPGPDTYYWEDFERADDMNLKAIPRTASVIPGTNKEWLPTAAKDQDMEPVWTEDDLSLQKLENVFRENNVQELLGELYDSEREDRFGEEFPDEYPRF